MVATNHPKVFISYSWDSKTHRDWVRYFAEQLMHSGVEVRLDQWHLKPGESFTHFMEGAVADSDNVVVVLTANYARKSNSRKGGVGYEQQIISGQIMAGLPRSKFIPIIRSGNYEVGPRCAIPTHFTGIVSIDFRRKLNFAERLEELVRTIFSSPKFAPPLIGCPPTFYTSQSTTTAASTSEHIVKWGDLILNYAYYNNRFSTMDLALNWMYAYQRFLNEGTLTENLDIVMSNLPMKIDEETSEQELDTDLLDATLDYLVVKGYLKRNENYPLLPYEITDIGKSYFSNKLVEDRLRNSGK